MEKDKKSEGKGIYIERINNSSVFCLTNGANYSSKKTFFGENLLAGILDKEKISIWLEYLEKFKVN